VASEIKVILDHFRIRSAVVIGHDIGPGDEIYNSPSIWHFRFNGPYADRLVQERERTFFDSL
jgi:hypothetical protein